jgi:DNA-binding NarL/FixJ family response regulator
MLGAKQTSRFIVNHTCVLLGERHHSLSDGVRGLLETTFGTVFMVADAVSLMEGATRLLPTLVVVDVTLAGGDLPQLLGRLRERAPSARVLVLSVHDERTIASDALAAGADGLVVKSRIAAELLPAVDAILAGRQFVSASAALR